MDDFEINDNQLISYLGNSEEVTIPEGVIYIENDAFANCESITTVHLPYGLQHIGDNAFAGCTNLTHVNIPYGVTYIGEEAFLNCRSLTNVQVPNSVVHVGYDAFNGTPFISEYRNYPSDFIVLGNGILYKYRKNDSFVIIPDSVNTITRNAFEDCESLRRVIIPNSVTHIENYAFDGTPYIETYTEDYIILGDGILYQYNGFSDTITIPHGVKRIEDNLFEGMQNLTSIDIPDSVLSIGNFTFFGCSNLDIVLPSSVKQIGVHTFTGCKSVRRIKAS
jgi:hypothetical protein